MRRFSVEDGIESLQKQAHAPFGSIRFDEVSSIKQIVSNNVRT